MAGQIVTVFGGTGFLGHGVAYHLLGHGLEARVASRSPSRLPPAKGLQWIGADINDEGQVAAAIAGSYGVVNAISLYRERGRETFHSMHVRAAERLARQAQRAGVARLVHVSGIGADVRSGSRYIRSRGEGELAVATRLCHALILRPAPMVGPRAPFFHNLVQFPKKL